MKHCEKKKCLYSLTDNLICLWFILRGGKKKKANDSVWQDSKFGFHYLNKDSKHFLSLFWLKWKNNWYLYILWMLQAQKRVLKGTTIFHYFYKLNNHDIIHQLVNHSNYWDINLAYHEKKVCDVYYILAGRF